MRGVRAACLVMLTAGCGRFGFSGREATDGAVRDGVVDTRADTQSSVCMNALVCDGFEGSTIGSNWQPFGAVAIDDTFAHTGNSSVHMHIDPIASGGSMESRIADPTVLMAQGPLWVRAWFKLGSLPAGSNHMELMCAGQSTAPFNGVCVFLYSTQTTLYTQFTNGTIFGSAPPAGPWFCYVWNLVRAPNATGAMRLISDVIPTLDMPAQQTDSSTNPIDYLALGPNFSPSNTPTNQPALEVWMDDLIVSTSPVTCSD